MYTCDFKHVEAKAGSSQMWGDLDYVLRPILKNKNKKDFYKAYYY